MPRGESPDSGADTYARSEESWQSSRRTACLECTVTRSSAQTAKNAKPRAQCRFQYWIWTGRSSTIRNASFVWLALMHAQLERSLRSSHRRISYLRWRSLWSRGWESNPLQPSIPGCLLRVATRCFCSPSPEPIGLRWTMPTPASCPRRF